MSKETSYVIYKQYINDKGVLMPIALINNVSEIMEFNDEDEAIRIATLFETNSDSGWKYVVKKIN
jgi:hypothetical protein